MRLRSKILAGIALVAVIGAVALASSGSSELSSSRWAVESGLPELPPARDNGWLILTAEDGSFELSDEPDAVIEARTAISDQSRSVDERWQALTDARSGVSRMVGRSSHGEDLQRWHAASDAVAFADAWWPPHFLYDAHQTSEVLATVHHDLLSMSEPTVEWTLRDRVLNPLGCALVDPQRLHSSYAGHHESLDASLSKAERWRREILERWGEGPSAP